MHSNLQKGFDALKNANNIFKDLSATAMSHLRCFSLNNFFGKNDAYKYNIAQRVTSLLVRDRNQPSLCKGFFKTL